MNYSNRRDFLKMMSAGAGIMSLSFPGIFLQACMPSNSTGELFKLFQVPDTEARPFFRWWWNGNRVVKEELLRELRVMKEAGAGGVEINPIGMNENVKNPKAKEVEWLSDEWIKLVEATINEGDKIDMSVDLIVGTGWPFGGRFLKDDETIRGFDLVTVEVVKSKKQLIDVFSYLKEGAQLRQLKLVPEPLKSLSDIRDMTNDMVDGQLILEGIPQTSRLYILSWRNKFREVMHGALGGDGPVLDHFNKTAVEKYLDRTSNALSGVLGENGQESRIRAMFCDSIELAGANWTTDFAKEFKERKGYDIEPFLPLVLNNRIESNSDINGKIQRMRFDYGEVLSQLYTERFLLPYHNWCRRIGVKSRYQAYGVPWLLTDLLEGNMVPDIPESDQWLFNGGWAKTNIDNIRYAIWNKYASSAANLRGLKIVSCEAMTNTNGVFSTSLEYIKQATDLNIISGVNHLVLHGYNYSPPDEGFPGWIRYGTYFSDKNTWWPYFKKWADYCSRLCAVTQNSQAVSQVAIIGPTADIWQKYGLERQPFNTEPEYLHDIWQAMNHYGYCSDYLNPRIVQEAEFSGGLLKYGAMEYQCLLVANMKTCYPGFVDAVERAAQNGVKIIFIGSVPVGSPGMKHDGDNQVEEKMKALLTLYPEQIKMVEEPTMKGLDEWVRILLERENVISAVQIENTDPKLYVLSKKAGEKPVYFFSNMNRDKTIAFTAKFPVSDFTPWRWDAGTGEKSVFPYGSQPNHFEILLQPLESLLLVFEKGVKDSPEIVSTEKPERLSLKKDWKVKMVPVEGTENSIDLAELTNLAKIPEYESFAGTLIYTKTFFTEEDFTLLKLKEVHEIAEVALNGVDVGVKWWGIRDFDITGLIRKGENHLEIKVTTLLWNYCNSFSMEENPMAKLWARSNSDKSLKPCGLVGDAVLC